MYFQLRGEKINEIPQKHEKFSHHFMTFVTYVVVLKPTFLVGPSEKQDRYLMQSKLTLTPMDSKQIV